jgi:hypothetical protein
MTYTLLSGANWEFESYNAAGGFPLTYSTAESLIDGGWRKPVVELQPQRHSKKKNPATGERSVALLQSTTI